VRRGKGQEVSQGIWYVRLKTNVESFSTLLHLDACRFVSGGPRFPKVFHFLLSSSGTCGNCTRDRETLDSACHFSLLLVTESALLQCTSLTFYFRASSRVDVFHAPFVYDQKNKKRGRKASVAAIIAQVVRSNTNEKSPMEIYSKTFSRSGGNEYQLGDALKHTVSETCRSLKVKPARYVTSVLCCSLFAESRHLPCVPLMVFMSTPFKMFQCHRLA